LIVKTLLIIVVLLGVAVAAGASFVVGGGAQEGEAASAELGGGCRARHDYIPAGEDAIIGCTFTATNTGGTSLASPEIYFVPSSAVAPPERYFFFRYMLDGVERPTTGTGTTYEFNTITPGKSSRIELEIIVRASQPFGADVLLGANGALDRMTVANEVHEALGTAAGQQMFGFHRLLLAGGPVRASFDSILVNVNSARILEASVELHPGAGATLREGPWEPVDGSARFTHVFGDMAWRTAVNVVAHIESTDSDCLYAAPAAIASIQFEDGTVRVPALSDLPMSCGSTMGYEGVALPAGGNGGYRERVEPVLTLVAMLAGIVGFATIGMAVFLVR
jgi:hypothetical protein